MTKTCNKCDNTFNLSFFYPKTSARGQLYANSAAGYSSQCKKCDRIARKLYVSLNPDKTKASDRGYHLSRYGLTISDYNALFAAQQGCCRGCTKHQSEFKTRLCVDHCHLTGKVRGLLCAPCNLILGYANDNLTVLTNLHNYLAESAAIINTDMKAG